MERLNLAEYLVSGESGELTGCLARTQDLVNSNRVGNRVSEILKILEDCRKLDVSE